MRNVALCLLMLTCTGWIASAQPPAPPPSPTVAEPAPPKEPERRQPPVAAPETDEPDAIQVPTPVAPEPAEPAVGAPMAPGGVPVPQPFSSVTDRYPTRITEEFAPWTLDFLEQYPAATAILSLGQLFARPLIFLAVLLTLGLVFSGMVRHIIEPPAKDARSVDAGAADRTKRFAKWNLVVWLLSFLVAWEAIDLHSFMGSIGEILGALVGFVGALVGALVWLVVAMIIAYSFSATGRDFVMSLLGWWYLRYHQAKPREGQMFDLGEGKMGTVKCVDVLQTTFILPGGEEQTMPNSWLMREHFHWDQGKG